MTPKRFVGTIPKPERRRFGFSVPDTDQSVLNWLGAQSDVSMSLRTLIRDSIRENGYVDVTCYPVEQLPRRGRPRKSEIEETPQVETEVETKESETVPLSESESVVEKTKPSQPSPISQPTNGDEASNRVVDMLGALR